MKYSLAAVGLVALILPLSASAQAIVTHTNASPQGGIGIFAGGEGDAQTGSYLTALTNDINAHYNLFSSSKGSAPLTTTQVNSAGIWAGSGSDSYGFVTGAASTLNRVCDDIDSTLGSGHNGKMTGYTGDSYSSEGNNSIILFNGSQWRWQAAKGSTNHHLRSLVCASYALPQNTLTANDYSISSGQSVTLTWNDSAARDQLTTADGSSGDVSNPVPSTSCTATGFTLPTTPVQVCTSSEMEPSGGGCALLYNGASDASNLAAAQIGADSDVAVVSGGCTYHRVCLTHKTVYVADPSGSVTVRPTATTNYTYTCKNANGTTVASAKVTVANPAVNGACSATHYSCTAGTSGSHVSGTTSYTWKCVGSDGGTTASCSEAKPVDGVCAATHYSCSVGTSSSNVNGSTSYTWKCLGSNGGATDTCSEAKSLPNLKAAGITEDSVPAAGVPMSYYRSVITNAGNASTGVGFTVLFQKATSAAGANATDIGTYSMAAVGANASRTALLTYTFPSAGVYYMRACADKSSATNNGVITESVETDNCGTWTQITVGSPDLTAGNVTPTTAATGAATTLTSTVTNGGNAVTSASFTDLFEINPDTIPATFADIKTLRTDTSPALDAGDNDVPQVSYTFPSPGTYYVRACADMNASGNGAIAESNENNNCSPSWTAVTVTTPTLTCDVSDTTIDQSTGSQTVTYTASPTTASPYAWTASDGATGFGTNYSTTRNFSSVTPGVYGMTVSASGYVSATCPQVTVSNPCTAAALTLTASPTRVGKGDTSTLSWVIPSVANNVASCTLKGSDGSTYTIPVSSCQVTDGGGDKDTDPIQGQTTYTLTCGGQTATAIVDVIPNFNEF